MKIEIKNLTKVYGMGLNSVLALNDLNLTVNENEICIVRGPNGSGKSTLISILSGQIEPTVGQVRLSSENSNSPVISVVTQFHNLIEEFTIKEHFVKLNRLENLNLIDENLLDKKPSQISRGQAQLISIALAMSSTTDLLLADEPTGALGSEDSEFVYEFIRNTAHKNNCAVVLVTHDQNAEKIADRIVRLRDGRISETWKSGQRPLQVVSPSGWVRIPDQVLTGLAQSVSIEVTESGGLIVGRDWKPIEEKQNLIKKQSTSSTLISAENLSTKYGLTLISRNLTFAINELDLFCVYGKAGSGKTTLLKTICGLHPDYSGELIRSTTEQIAYFNVENIFGLELSLTQLIPDSPYIEKLKLTEIADRDLDTYSGGQKQRALIAIALSSELPVIAIDEPISALDEQIANLVIEQLIESTKTLIISSHESLQPNVITNSIQLS